jgi:class 3 adenylate cyclase
VNSSKKLLFREPASGFATVLFCDIRGFTSLFDERDPMEALGFANTVLAVMGSIVEACGGTIDKFTGDGFLAHFGVLGREQEDVDAKFAEAACWCAIRIRECLTEINLTRHIREQPTVEVGIGIHSGVVASGVISTFSKSEFTVLGTTVNTASRIESLTKEFSVDCLVSDDLYKLCSEKFDFQPMPVRILRGLKASRLTYWLLPTNLFMNN